MKQLLFILCLFAAATSCAQSYNNHWIMGYGTQWGIPYGGIDLSFNNQTANAVYTAKPMDLSTTSASVSDSAGNLLFYTNGVYIADNTDQQMQNGGGINPSLYTSSVTLGMNLVQSHIVINRPAHPGSYYLIHSTLDGIDNSSVYYTQYVYLSEINMAAAGGLGAVVRKNIILLDHPVNQGGLSAVKHANGRDWWVVCHENNSRTFITFLVLADTVFGPFTQQAGSLRHGYSSNHNFSPDGNRYVIADALNDVDLMDFDRCTGLFSNSTHLDIPDTTSDHGVAFSADGSKLYVSSLEEVYQFDLNASVIDSSRIIVAQWDSTYDPLGVPFAAYFRICRLAPDNRIYISTSNGTRYLHVINSPDSLGLLCDLQQHALTLPALNYNSLPLYPDFNLGAVSGPCDTITDLTEIESEKIKAVMYPNPASSYTELEYYNPAGSQLQFILTDQQGKTLYTRSVLHFTGMITISTSDLSAGIYYWHLVNKNSMRITTGKLAVIH